MDGPKIARMRRRRPILLLAWLLAGACTPSPPEATPHSERARVLAEYRHHRRTAAAATACHQLMLQWGGSGEIREVYARMLFETGALPQAEHQVHLALNAPLLDRQSRAWALYTQARIDAARGNWAAAAARCKDALTVQPQARWELMRRARTLLAELQRLQRLAEWRTHPSAHFVFHYPEVSVRAADMAAHVAELATTRDAAFEHLAVRLGVEMDAPIHVYLHETAAEIAAIFGAADVRLDMHARTIHEAPEHDAQPAIARLLAAGMGKHLIREPLVAEGLVAYLTTPDQDPPAGDMAAPAIAELYANYDALPDAVRRPAARAFVGSLIEQHGLDTFKRFWARLAWVSLPKAAEDIYRATLTDLTAGAATDEAAENE